MQSSTTAPRVPRAVQLAVQTEGRFKIFEHLFSKLTDDDLVFLQREDLLALEPDMAPSDKLLLLVMFNKYLCEPPAAPVRPTHAIADVSLPAAASRLHPLFTCGASERKFDPATDGLAKNLLQEHCAKRSLENPVYIVLKKTGSEHLPMHYVQCTACNLTTCGYAVSRGDAEKAAAAALLALLGK